MSEASGHAAGYPHTYRHVGDRFGGFLMDSGSETPAWLRALEPLAYSSVLAAGVAGALVAATQRASGMAIDLGIVVLACAGTFVVYNVDRLRDLARDRGEAPARSAFVERHARGLRGLTGLALLASVVASTQLEATGLAICGAVLLAGLAHRRLKRIRGIKTLYLVGSWIAVTLLLPLYGMRDALSPDTDRTLWLAAILCCALVANFVASNLDRGPKRVALDAPARRRKLSVAIAVAGLGMGFALVAPEPLRPMLAIPSAQFLALVRYRDSEAYRAIVVDGALLVGAIAALLLAGVG